MIAILSHLSAHAAADQRYFDRLQSWTGAVAHARLPVVEGNMLAMPAAEFQSRIRAFTRVGRSLPTNLLLQDFTSCQSSSERALPGTQDSKIRLRHGSFIFPDIDGDGEVVLKICQEQRKVQTALVQRHDSCLRRPRCVCYHVCNYNRQWKSMDEVTGTVLCLSPRFGWKHDFALSLQKVCWRRASVLGNARSEAIVNAPSQPEVMRAAKLLDLCRASLDLFGQDFLALRSLGNGLGVSLAFI